MRPTRRTRKPIDELTQTDLRTFPIWEFATDGEAIDGQDETWVRPLEARAVPANAFSLSVAATFCAPIGATYRGIVEVTTADRLEIGHAAVITPDGYVFIPAPDFPRATEAARAAAQQLHVATSALFPLTYELVLPLEGEKVCLSGVYTYAFDA